MRWTWTEKAKAALAILNNLGLDTSKFVPMLDLGRIYWEMDNRGYFWENGEWIFKPLAILPASEEISIRIRGDSSKMSTEILKISQALSGAGYNIIEISEVYPRKFPRINDSSVYIRIK